MDCPLDGEGRLFGEVNGDLAVGVSRGGGVGGRKCGEEHLTSMEASGGRLGSMAYVTDGGIVCVIDHRP